MLLRWLLPRVMIPLLASLVLAAGSLLVGPVLPQGTTLALFTRGIGGNMAAKLEIERGLTVEQPITGAYLNMHWGPDGRTLWLAMAGFRADTPPTVFGWLAGRLEPVATLPLHTMEVAWSPDSAWSVVKVDEALYRLPASGVDEGAPQRITNEGYEAYEVHWSPDGRQLLYLLRFTHENDLVHYFHNQVTVRDLSTGQETQIRRTMDTIYGLYWLPDGQRIAYGEVDDVLVNLYLHDLDTGESRPLIDDFRFDVLDAIWSPDGARVALQAGGGIMIAEAGGDSARPLQGGLPNNTLLNWSPDGEMLLVRSESRGLVLYSELDRAIAPAQVIYSTGMPVYDVRWRP